jgi:hypothetical protein
LPSVVSALNTHLDAAVGAGLSQTARLSALKGLLRVISAISDPSALRAALEQLVTPVLMRLSNTLAAGSGADIGSSANHHGGAGGGGNSMNLRVVELGALNCVFRFLDVKTAAVLNKKAGNDAGGESANNESDS